MNDDSICCNQAVTLKALCSGISIEIEIFRQVRTRLYRKRSVADPLWGTIRPAWEGRRSAMNSCHAKARLVMATALAMCNMASCGYGNQTQNHRSLESRSSQGIRQPTVPRHHRRIRRLSPPTWLTMMAPSPPSPAGCSGPTILLPG